MPQESFAHSLAAAKPVLDCLQSLRAKGEDPREGWRIDFSTRDQELSEELHPTLVVTYQNLLPEDVEQKVGIGPGLPHEWLGGHPSTGAPAFLYPALFVVLREGRYDVQVCMGLGRSKKFGQMYVPNLECPDLGRQEFLKLLTGWLKEMAPNRPDYDVVLRRANMATVTTDAWQLARPDVGWPRVRAAIDWLKNLGSKNG
jgi:hypothetical protein